MGFSWIFPDDTGRNGRVNMWECNVFLKQPASGVGQPDRTCPDPQIMRLNLNSPTLTLINNKFCGRSQLTQVYFTWLVKDQPKPNFSSRTIYMRRSFNQFSVYINLGQGLLVIFLAHALNQSI